MATYYIRSDGNDSNSGTANNSGGAWLTIEKAFTALSGSGSHTVNIGSGTFAWPSGVGRTNFPTDSGDPDNVFTNWVDFVGAGTGSTTIAGLTLGGNSGSSPNFFGAINIGSWDAYFRLYNILFSDEVKVFGARYFEIHDCLFNLPGDLSGSTAAIDRDSLLLRGGRHISIDDCEFTSVTTAISVVVWDSEIINCHIHDITHDGIRITGSNNLLVDSNRIYNLDDGYTDTEQPVYSRHCDGIHVYMQGPGGSDERNVGITLSNNLIYNTESHLVQFNNFQDGEHHNTDITVFNNIFGQSQAVSAFNGAERVDGFKFYHNTFLLSQNSNSFTSAYRTVVCDGIDFNLRPDWTNVKIYNNIIANVPETWGVHANVSNNLYVARTVGEFGDKSGGKNAIFTTTDQFVDSDAFTAIPISGFSGKNLGTKLNRNGTANSDIPSVDYYGTSRDNRPDIGAYEFSGESPSAEPTFSYLNDSKTLFHDNFDDGDPFEDIEIGTTSGKRGIAWSPTNSDTLAGQSAYESYTNRYNHTSSRSELNSPQGTSGPYFLICSNSPSTANITFDYHVVATASAVDDGILIFHNDSNNYIYMSIGRTAGGTGLRMVAAGVESTIDTLTGFTLGNGTDHQIDVTVSHSNETLTYSVNLDSGTAKTGTADISGMNAIGSSFGLVRTSSVSDHIIKFFDFNVIINDSIPSENYIFKSPNGAIGLLI